MRSLAFGVALFSLFMAFPQEAGAMYRYGKYQESGSEPQDAKFSNYPNGTVNLVLRDGTKRWDVPYLDGPPLPGDDGTYAWGDGSVDGDALDAAIAANKMIPGSGENDEENS